MFGANVHPQIAMKDMGITYKQAIPQSLGDQWWFQDCENVPDPLPLYLEVMEIPERWRK